jgi:hypothetical protein
MGLVHSYLGVNTEKFRTSPDMRLRSGKYTDWLRTQALRDCFREPRIYTVGASVSFMFLTKKISSKRS